MKVVVDLLFIIPGKNRGTQTYVDSLLAELALLKDVKLICLTNKANHSHYEKFGYNCYKTIVGGDSRFFRILYQQFVAPRIARRLGANILFCPGYLSPVFPRLPTVPVIHDMNYLDVPNSASFSTRKAYEMIIPRGSRAAAKVITVSHFSKERIVDLLGLNKEAVVVVHEGPLAIADTGRQIDWETLKRKYAISSECFLSVCSGAHHKNVERLVDGFLLMRDRTGADVNLVLVGHNLGEPVMEKLRHAAPDHGVIVTGFISDEEKVLFLKNSLAYLFPSLYEGFGLPALEAHSCGLPLAASRYGSLPEVCGDAALYFDAMDTTNIADAIETLYVDKALREKLTEAGYRNVQHFSWKRAAEETRDVFASILNAKK